MLRVWKPFEIRVPGKWVLAGEHAVLRGAEAVALPHADVWLDLRFRPVDAGFKIVGALWEEAVRALLADLEIEPQGELRIESTIPQGAGLGSSAALCVAMTEWLAEPLGLAPEMRAEFATRLEDRFHGKSSGMDVGVVAAGMPVEFHRLRGPEPIAAAKLPRFTFHDTGLRSSTRECIERVEALVERDPALGSAADQAMAAAAREAVLGLKAFGEEGAANEGEGLLQVARAMTRAHECFETWGLVPSAACAIRRDLLAQGALAAKLTGAGGGGFVVALWPN